MFSYSASTSLCHKFSAVLVSSILFFTLGFTVFFTAGCSTPQHKVLKAVQVGMDKATVLELVGNPTRISRHLGQDRWSYENSFEADETARPTSGSGDADGAKDRTTYVYFSEGRVTYVGGAAATVEPVAPASVRPTRNSTDRDHTSDPKNSGFKSVGE